MLPNLFVKSPGQACGDGFERFVYVGLAVDGGDEHHFVLGRRQKYAASQHGVIVGCIGRFIGRTRVVNPGSVGMPFGPAGAYWMILGPGVEMRHTTYDFERAAERIRASGYPAAEEFVTKSVLHPPSAEEMEKLYGQYELKG